MKLATDGKEMAKLQFQSVITHDDGYKISQMNGPKYPNVIGVEKVLKKLSEQSVRSR